MRISRVVKWFAEFAGLVGLAVSLVDEWYIFHSGNFSWVSGKVYIPVAAQGIYTNLTLGSIWYAGLVAFAILDLVPLGYHFLWKRHRAD